jgi:hypothetical protein
MAEAAESAVFSRRAGVVSDALSDKATNGNKRTLTASATAARNDGRRSGKETKDLDKPGVLHPIFNIAPPQDRPF